MADPPSTTDTPKATSARKSAVPAPRSSKSQPGATTSSIPEAGPSKVEAEPERDPNRLPQTAARLLHSFGLEGSRRNNVCYISENVLQYSAGNAVHFFNVKTKKIEAYLPSVEGHGIGAVCVHPTKKYFAVCEKGHNPGIYVYEYPSLKFSKQLHDGTENQYTAAAFSPDGTQLATVGGYPDYWLSVWDWSGESIILRSKAFSQDVFQVSFSRVLPGTLITSGVGHIRFWKMAVTFTGLKLEGQIAKFGTVPISDIAGYAELKNGKVISGTEVGSILLWDGGLVKCQLTRPAGAPCHDGMIEVLLLDEAHGQMITAAADGFVRFWGLEWLEQADDGDDKLVVEIVPRREVQVDKNCKIKGILFEADHWIIQDEGGAIWKVHTPSFDIEKIFQFHASSITGVASSPSTYFIASGGSDGSVKLYNYKEPHQIQSRTFSTAVTSLLWLPLRLDPSSCTIIAGFADGVIRILQQTVTNWRLLQALKPHKMDVTAMRLTPDAEILATTSTDTSVFFFHTVENYRPIGYVMGPGQITCADWSPDGKGFLMGCSNGVISHLNRPDLHPDTSVTFELKPPLKSFTYRLPKPPKKIELVVEPPPVPVSPEVATSGDATGDQAKKTEESGEGGGVEEAEEKEGAEGGEEVADGKEVPPAAPAPEVPAPPEPEPEPEEEQPICTLPVRAILYTNGTLSTFYIAIEGKGMGYLYECRLDSKEVLGTAKWLATCVKCLGYSPGKEYLVSGSDDGVVRIHAAPVPGELQHSDQLSYWEGAIHDGFKGVVGGAVLSFDNMYLASVGYDGSFFIHFLDLKIYPDKEGKPINAVKAKPEAQPEAADLGAGVYSIEEAKQKAEKDRQLILALQKKALVLTHVEAIRKALSDLIKENEAKTAIEKLDISEFEIDPHLRVMIQAETEANVDMAHKELQYESERRNIALRKLRAYFLDDIEVEHIVLHAFHSGKTVSTFRTARLSQEILDLIEEARIQVQGLKRPVKTPVLIRKEIHQPGDETRVKTDEDEGIFKVEHPVGDTMEDRRLLMKKREREWLTFLKSKPDETYVNQEDALAIKWAEENKGDFKLKSDPDYRAPEELETNATRKRNEMLLFVEAVHKAKMEYNAKFLALRVRKKEIEGQIIRGNARIKEINGLLKVKDEVLFVPQKFRDETPEDREIVTQQEMDDLVAKRKAAEEAAKNEGKSSGFTSGLGAAKEGADKDGSLRIGRRSVSPQQRKRTPEKAGPTPVRVYPPSALELAEQEAAQIKLKYEMEKILEKMEIAVNNFDHALEELRQTKMRTEINMNMAAQKFLFLFEELRLLKVLTPTEEALKIRHAQKVKDVTDFKNKVQEQENAIENNKQQTYQFHEVTKKVLCRVGSLGPVRKALRGKKLCKNPGRNCIAIAIAMARRWAA